jgi:hypothetical protein
MLVIAECLHGGDRQQKKLRVKTDKTRWTVGGKGIASFAMSVWQSDSGKIMQPVVLSVLPGKGHERKEASFADLIFASFYQEKEERPPRP